jgi:hypothetical protein
MAVSKISDAQVKQYRSQGYLCPIDALTADEAAKYYGALTGFESTTGRKAAEVLRGKGHLKLMALYELVHHPRILDAVEAIVGPNVLCWNSSLFMKEPGDPAYVAWHQDVYDFDIDSDAVVTAWVALLPSMPENGAMQVVPGSQHNRLVPHVSSPPGSATMLRDHLEIGVTVDKDQAVSLTLAAGQISMHHMYLFHGSPPNTSTERRCGFAIRYVAPHVCRKGDPYAATVVRGTDAIGHFGKDPAPTRDLDPEIVAYVDRFGKPRLKK